MMEFLILSIMILLDALLSGYGEIRGVAGATQDEAVLPSMNANSQLRTGDFGVASSGSA